MMSQFAGKLNINTLGVWRVAATLLGWLLMGTWMAAKISAGNEALRDDMKNLRSDVHTISQRLDAHIDQTINVPHRKDKQ